MSKADEKLEAFDVALGSFGSSVVGVAVSAATNEPNELYEDHCRRMSESREAVKTALQSYVEAVVARCRLALVPDVTSHDE